MGSTQSKARARSYLPLLGAMPAAAARPGSTLLAKGFRPFFLLAAASAVGLLAAWLLVLGGVLPASHYFAAPYWHAHEMVFGYTTAVIAGFLLTAVGNWTQRETLVGAPLFALCLLWVLGRAALVIASLLPRWLPAALDLAFLPALAFVIGRPLIAVRSRRNYVMLVLLAALFFANLCTHLDALGVLAGWQRRGSLLGIDIVIAMILVVTARILPGFTRNSTGVETILSRPRLDALSVLAMGVLTICDAAEARPGLVAVAAATTSVLAALRSLRWGARGSLGIPLLWILHFGCAWVPIGLGLRALSALTPAVPASLATHALTAGAISSLTLGMMARVALGHTGRPLHAPKPMTLSFVLVTLAAVARVFAPLLNQGWYRLSLFVAGSAWVAAFAIYCVVYVPVLVAPRVDGKAG